MEALTAENFIHQLKAHQSEAEKKKIRRYFKADDPHNRVIGVRMKNTFDLAKEWAEMPLDEIEKLLDSPYYEARMGAVSIMDFRVRKKTATEELRKQLFDLYLNRHDRLNNWDFMDRAAPRVIGSYLFDYKKPRKVLYKLATSDDPWERRTSIVSTAWFLRKGELNDTFKLTEILLNDEHEYVQKAIGTWMRHAGKQDESRLLKFLEKHAPDIERTTLTTMMENLTKAQKEYYRKLKSSIH
jgi:3-methyladenine DNA glycosylase AlkD